MLKLTSRFFHHLIFIPIFTLSLTFILGCPQKIAPEKLGGALKLSLMEPVSLDPANLQESEGIMVGKQIYDGLVDYDPKTLEIKPALAQSWTSNREATVWTFKLKKGIKFHNGREVKAKDFVYSWDRIANPKTASEVAYHLSPIKGFEEHQEGKAKELVGVEAPSDYVFKVTLSYPYAEFVNTLGHPVFSPVPKEEIKKKGPKFSEHPIGAGPFKFKEWKHDQRIVLKRNPDYYGQTARLDEIIFKIFPDEETAFLEFKAGGLEATIIPASQIKAVKEDKKFGKYVKLEDILANYYYGFNMETSPWKGNKKLRQTLGYLVDREAIAKTIFEGAFVPATGFVPRGIPGFQEKAMPYTFNLKKAKKLLEAAGYPGGKGLPKLTLSYNTEIETHAKVAQTIQDSAKKVGVNLELVGYEFGTLLDKIQTQELTFFRLGWGADYPTLDNFLYPSFFSKNVEADNMTFYRNKKVDKLLLAARKQTDAVRRKSLYREAERVILEDAPVIPIGFEKSAWVVQPYVKGFERTAMDDTALEKVWLKKK